MDEIKLTTWRNRFEQDIDRLQTGPTAFFLNKPLQDIYTIELNESDEWKLQGKDNVPNEIKSGYSNCLWLRSRKTAYKRKSFFHS